MEKASVKLGQDRKRKRVFFQKEAPFPVPVSSITGLPTHADKWYYYTGQLEENYVAVDYSGDMDFLYKMGFFGKGNLSRHQPVYNQGGIQMNNRRKQENKQHMLKITSRRKYLRHVAWDTGQSIDMLPLRKVKSRQGDQYMQKTNVHNDIGTTISQSNKSEEQSDSPISKKVKLVEENPKESEDNWNEIVKNDDDWPDVTMDTEEDPWATTTQEESCLFWGVPQKQENKEQESCGLEFDCNNITNEAVNECNVVVKDGGNGTNETSEHENMNSAIGNTHSILVHSQAAGTDKEPTSHSKSEINIVTDSDETDSQILKSVNLTDSKSGLHLTIKDKETSSDILSNSGDNNPSLNMASEKETPIESETSNITLFTMEIEPNQSDLNITIASNEKLECTDDIKIDPLCLSDHEDGDLFVVNDTDESDNEAGTESLQQASDDNISNKNRTKWEPAVKRDPSKQKEVLHLSFEEAFFLSYGLGCLVILDDNKKPLNLTELWCEFSKRQKTFISHYIVYHNFRSKGWVPKSGLKFGGDFMLYKVGPPFYHASYVVMVRTVDGNTLQETEDNQDKFSWRLIAGQNRVTEQAAKELMICYVIKPSYLSDVELLSPKCITKFKVQEMIIRRWLTKHERDNLHFVEIP